MTKETQQAFKWTGAFEAFLDRPDIVRYHDVVIGRYGGHSAAGAVTNEDAAWVLRGSGWRFSALVDAHYSNDSNHLILGMLERQREAIAKTLSEAPGRAFEGLRSLLLRELGSEDLRSASRSIVGEASCIFAAQKSKFLFWLSIGDCLAFVLHPEFARLGQFAINQRHFFEWVGRANVFNEAAATHSSGVQELRQGLNTIAVVTDGLYEFPFSPYGDPAAIYAALGPERQLGDLHEGVIQALETVHNGLGRDSATVVAWQANVSEKSLRSSPLPR